MKEDYCMLLVGIVVISIIVYSSNKNKGKNKDIIEGFTVEQCEMFDSIPILGMILKMLFCGGVEDGGMELCQIGQKTVEPCECGNTKCPTGTYCYLAGGISECLTEERKKDNPCEGVDCGDFGNCEDGECVCAKGYEGNECQHEKEKCDESECGNGVLTQGSIYKEGGCRCNCYPGWVDDEGEICSKRVRIDLSKSPCVKNNTCTKSGPEDSDYICDPNYYMKSRDCKKCPNGSSNVKKRDHIYGSISINDCECDNPKSYLKLFSPTKEHPNGGYRCVQCGGVGKVRGILNSGKEEEVCVCDTENGYMDKGDGTCTKCPQQVQKDASSVPDSAFKWEINREGVGECLCKTPEYIPGEASGIKTCISSPLCMVNPPSGPNHRSHSDGECKLKIRPERCQRIQASADEEAQIPTSCRLVIRENQTNYCETSSGAGTCRYIPPTPYDSTCEDDFQKSSNKAEDDCDTTGCDFSQGEPIGIDNTNTCNGETRKEELKQLAEEDSTIDILKHGPTLDKFMNSIKCDFNTSDCICPDGEPDNGNGAYKKFCRGCREGKVLAKYEDTCADGEGMCTFFRCEDNPCLYKDPYDPERTEKLKNVIGLGCLDAYNYNQTAGKKQISLATGSGDVAGEIVSIDSDYKSCDVIEGPGKCTFVPASDSIDGEDRCYGEVPTPELPSCSGSRVESTACNIGEPDRRECENRYMKRPDTDEYIQCGWDTESGDPTELEGICRPWPIDRTPGLTEQERDTGRMNERNQCYPETKCELSESGFIMYGPDGTTRKKVSDLLELCPTGSKCGAPTVLGHESWKTVDKCWPLFEQIENGQKNWTFDETQQKCI